MTSTVQRLHTQKNSESPTLSYPCELERTSSDSESKKVAREIVNINGKTKWKQDDVKTNSQTQQKRKLEENVALDLTVKRRRSEEKSKTPPRFGQINACIQQNYVREQPASHTTSEITCTTRPFLKSNHILDFNPEAPMKKLCNQTSSAYSKEPLRIVSNQRHFDHVTKVQELACDVEKAIGNEADSRKKFNQSSPESKHQHEKANFPEEFQVKKESNQTLLNECDINLYDKTSFKDVSGSFKTYKKEAGSNLNPDLRDMSQARSNRKPSTEVLDNRQTNIKNVLKGLDQSSSDYEESPKNKSTSIGLRTIYEHPFWSPIFPRSSFHGAKECLQKGDDAESGYTDRRKQPDFRNDQVFLQSFPSFKEGGNQHLRSYEKYFPTHFLPLMKSSGSTTNRLSHVTAFPEEVSAVGVSRVQTNPIEAKRANNHVTSRYSPVSSSHPDSTPSATSAFPSTLVTSQARILERRHDHFGNLIKWSGIEGGDFPAVGLPANLGNEKFFKRRRSCSRGEAYQFDEDYVTDATKQILRRAKQASVAKQVCPSLSTVVTADEKQMLLGYENQDKKVYFPTNEIWEHEAGRNSITSRPTSSTEVIHSSQRHVNMQENSLTPPVTSLDKEKAVMTSDRASEDVAQAEGSPNRKRDKGSLGVPYKNPEEQRRGGSLRYNDFSGVQDSHLANDDLLENSIEDSSDDEIDEKPIKNFHVSSTLINGKQVLNEKIMNGYPAKLTGIKTALKNIQLHSDLMRIIRSSNVMTSQNYGYFEHDNDIEISDDEDDLCNGRKAA